MYGREATIPIELQISSQPDSSEQVEDLTATYFKRLYQIIGPLEEDHRKAQQNIHRSQEKQVEQYGKKVHPHRYQIGDKVLLRNFKARKLDPKWNGPYYIHDIGPNGTYKLRTMDGRLCKKLVNANHLLPYFERRVNSDD
ncbi:unnamed protein product [Rhizophagus irregularis]|nr:unnamed protein product [Rhizophagus irregularis]